jgi:hypothetical protein
MSRIRTALVGVAAASLMLMTAGAASATPMSAGVASATPSSVTEPDNIALGNSWWLESPTQITTDVSTSQETESRDGSFSSYNAQIRQPINPDGSSTWPAKRGVVPVQFNLTASPTTEQRSVTTTTTAVTKVPSFKSIGSDGPGDPGANDWSALTHVPPAGTTVNDIEDLSAVFAYTKGESHGGSLRWQINLTNGKTINLYYGESASWTGQSGSGIDLADATDNRVETMSLNSVFYNTWAATKADFGTLGVASVALIVDSGWQQNVLGGDQEIDLSSATVNGSTVNVQDTYTGGHDVSPGAWPPGPRDVTSDEDTAQWVPGPEGTPVQTNAVPAKLHFVKVDNVPDGPVTEVAVSSAQGDTSGMFRQIDGKYMYNLKLDGLSAGTYKVYMNIDGQDIQSPGTFSLK